MQIIISLKEMKLLKVLKNSKKIRLIVFDIGDLSQDEGGLIKLRGLLAIAQTINDLNIGGWNQTIKENAGFGEMNLVAEVYQAENLIAGDKTGLSDAFCEINYYGIFKKTINKVFYRK